MRDFSLPVFESVAEKMDKKDCLALSSCNLSLRSFLPALGLKVRVKSIEEGVDTQTKGMFRVASVVCDMEGDERISSLLHLETATLLFRGTTFDLSLLSPLHNLRDLFICNAALDTLSPLSSCRILESLNLYFVSVSKKESFSCLKARQLLVSCPKLEEEVHFLPLHLERLNLRSETNFRFTPPPFPSMTSIVLFRCEEGDLSSLASLSLLKELHLIYCNRLKSVRFLSSMRRLESLSVTHSAVKDLSPLSSVPSVQNLCLEGTIARAFSPIKHLTGLRELDLSCTRIPDLGFLMYTPFLTHLNLCNTSIADFSPLADLPFPVTIKFS